MLEWNSFQTNLLPWNCREPYIYSGGSFPMKGINMTIETLKLNTKATFRSSTCLPCISVNISQSRQVCSLSDWYKHSFGLYWLGRDSLFYLLFLAGALSESTGIKHSLPACLYRCGGKEGEDYLGGKGGTASYTATPLSLLGAVWATGWSPL